MIRAFRISAQISARDGAGEGVDGDSIPLFTEELEALLASVFSLNLGSAATMASGLTGGDDFAIVSFDTVLSISLMVDLVDGTATRAGTAGATCSAFNTASMAERNIHPCDPAALPMDLSFASRTAFSNRGS